MIIAVLKKSAFRTPTTEVPYPTPCDFSAFEEVVHGASWGLGSHQALLEIPPMQTLARQLYAWWYFL